MLAKRLRVLDYRNYETADISLSPEVTLLTGSNAQGKTNLLEAIYLLCTGRSHRTPRDAELIRFGAQCARVRLDIEKSSGSEWLEIALPAHARRQILLSGTPLARVGEMMGHVNGVLFSPEDLRLVKDGPAERRRFMDMELSQIAPAYFFALQRYQRALKQRNALLRELPKQPSLERTLPDWDALLAEQAATVVRWRLRFVQQLGEVAQRTHREISGGETLQIQYESRYLQPDAEFVPSFLAALHDTRQEDIRRMSTTHGPHKDDLRLLINDHDARQFASQGQQRTAALALKLSEIQWMRDQTGETPILMLDDVMSELDEYRRKMLLETVHGVQTIVTMTSAERNLWPGCLRYSVDNGHVQPMP